MTIRDLLQSAQETLGTLEQPRLEAMLLLEHSLGRPRSWLIAHDDEAPDTRQQATFQQLLERRAQGEPLAYITGKREFWSLALEVNPDVLIPRPETELLVETALERIPVSESAQIADLGSGSGAITLAIASERPRATVIGVEFHPGALGVAQRNARRHNLDNVLFIHGPWLAPLHGRRFDVIVSNPPYVAEADPHLDALSYEPRSALAAGPDGLRDLRSIVADASAHLQPHGWLLLEHGADQGDAVRDLFAQSGFSDIETRRDLAGLERVTLGGRHG